MSWRDVELDAIRKELSNALARQRPVLAQLFHAALTAGQLAEAALPRAAELYAAIPSDSELDDGEWLAYQGMTTFASAQIEARDIYSEVLIASVARLLANLKRRLDLPEKAASESAVNGVAISELLRAARNNFSHRDGWNDPHISVRDRGTRDANVKVLELAGVANPSGSDACYETIRLLNVTQYLAFEALIERIAAEYYVKAGGRLGP